MRTSVRSYEPCRARVRAISDLARGKPTSNDYYYLVLLKNNVKKKPRSLYGFRGKRVSVSAAAIRSPSTPTVINRRAPEWCDEWDEPQRRCCTCVRISLKKRPARGGDGRSARTARAGRDGGASRHVPIYLFVLDARLFHKVTCVGQIIDIVFDEAKQLITVFLFIQ